ncbi:MAG: hypothetical protein ACNS62_17670 [Candidatus Cyclobacteriaceae bacterium M3_2C_046]
MKFISWLILLLLIPCSVKATTYYINSGNGSNQNDGLNPATAFYDFYQLDHVAVSPGDSILFARNSSYSGYFNLKYPGTPEQPVYVGSYGMGI